LIDVIDPSFRQIDRPAKCYLAKEKQSEIWFDLGRDDRGWWNRQVSKIVV
jgi:hypothetical protein